ncbi:DUF2459 domain-containing protein [Erythrobacter sp. MTPC3]|uniref:DUF2459 domain-containing protein n=1 Tax=Erythrobacter sp. MTPC3 TaxID=3056564 RepID=UPI0036F28E03
MCAKRKWPRRVAGAAALVILLPIAAFLLSAWIGSSLPRNSDWSEAEDGGIEIFIGENGIHTEIVMPVVMDGQDWRAHFDLGDTAAPDRPYTHVAVSWGERSFFLETPTWSDLDPAVGLNALKGGDGLMHIAWYVRPAPAEDFRPMRISRAEYRALSQGIIDQIAPVSGRQTYGGYGRHDVFYDALGTYHLFNTCNQWTSDRLAGAGIATGRWTPLPGGVMKWVPDLAKD